MTCIVGFEHDGIVTIGGDCAGTDSALGQTLRSDDKVFRVGAYAMGFTTSYRMGQLLRYRLNAPQLDTWDIDAFMATKFIDAVRECLKTGGWASVKDGREVGGAFLVGIKNRLYRVDSDFQVGRSTNGYDAVGSGQEVALGAMYAGVMHTPKLQVYLALTAAEHHNAGVSGPFTYVTTDRDSLASSSQHADFVAEKQVSA